MAPPVGAVAAADFAGRDRGDTIYLSAADGEGNVVSFIQSLFGSFGAGIVAGDTGITLHNRGSGFTLAPGHPNQIGPRKRPLHTLVPAMLLKNGRPWVAFGVMGGDNQAQAHAQMVMNFVDFGMHVQAAGDAARMRAHRRDRLALESGIARCGAGQRSKGRGHVSVTAAASGRLPGRAHRSGRAARSWADPIRARTAWPSAGDAPAGPSTSGPGLLAGGLIGGAFFLYLVGLRFVDPTSIGWIMKLDWATHYFGWTYFRLEPWQWPPGTVHGYNAPIGTAVGLTDSLPLMAYLLKPFSAWLPDDFQYLGAWERLCFALQGALGARLAGRFTPHLLPRLLLAALFVLLPMLLWRVAHAALMSHWLLLWCLLLATRAGESRCRWPEWAALGLLAGMIEPYLAAMVAALLGAIALGPGAGPYVVRGVALSAAAVAMVTGWWLSGMFNLGGTDGLSAGGLGIFSTNLLGPISPYGWSRLMPDWPTAGDGQLLEGTHYYGAGVLLLIAIAVVWTLTARRAGRAAALPAVFPWTVPVMSLALAAVALSPRVTLGSYVVVDLTGPWAAPLSLFRSTGRFLWPLTYVLLVWTGAVLLRRATPRVASVVLLAAIGVQLYDLTDFLADRRATAHAESFHTWSNPFISTRWPVIARHYRHLVLAPPPQCGPSSIGSEAALWFGTRHDLTVNTGTLSRGSEIARARYCRGLLEDLGAGRLEPSSIYLMTEAQHSLLAADAADVSCGRIDGLILCSTTASAPSWLRYAEAIPPALSARR